MVETDAPYLAPGTFRGKRNEPSHVVRVIETLAGVRNVSADHVAAVTCTNALRILGEVERGGGDLLKQHGELADDLVGCGQDLIALLAVALRIAHEIAAGLLTQPFDHAEIAAQSFADGSGNGDVAVDQVGLEGLQQTALDAFDRRDQVRGGDDGPHASDAGSENLLPHGQRPVQVHMEQVRTNPAHEAVKGSTNLYSAPPIRRRPPRSKTNLSRYGEACTTAAAPAMRPASVPITRLQ